MVEQYFSSSHNNPFPSISQIYIFNFIIEIPKKIDGTIFFSLSQQYFPLYFSNFHFDLNNLKKNCVTIFLSFSLQYFLLYFSNFHFHFHNKIPKKIDGTILLSFSQQYFALYILYTQGFFFHWASP